MGMHDFFDSLLSGFAFGLLTNNPFFGCSCYPSYNRVDFGTFANPFPSIFPQSYANNSNVPITNNKTFLNSYPKIDFSGIAESIWNTGKDLNIEYNKQHAIAEPQENITYYPSQTYTPIDMPFSSFFLQPFHYDSYIPESKPITIKQNKQSEETPKKSQTTDQNRTTTRNTKTTLNTKTVSTNVQTQPTVVSNNKKSVIATPLKYEASCLKSKWSKKTGNFPDEFFSRVINISKALNCNPDDLMAIMNLESRGFKLNAVNPKSGATGLIQFMPNTAKELGTTTQQIARMTALEQLDYVEKYLQQQKTRAGFSSTHHLNSGELYALIFRPKYAKNNVVAREGELAYKNNKILDTNKDGMITKQDLSNILNQFRA